MTKDTITLKMDVELRKVPGTESLYASPMGDIYDTEKEEFLEVSCGGRDKDYPYVRYTELNGRKYSELVARLVARAFHVPCDPTYHIVNHRNGNKLDSTVWNLEWVNHSLNSQHAYETGLRKDNRPIICYDLLSDEESRFNTLNQCAGYFGVNNSNIHDAVNATQRWPFLGRFELYYENERRMFLTADDLWKESGNHPTPVVHWLDEERAVLYPSVKACSIGLDITEYTVKKIAEGHEVRGYEELTLQYLKEVYEGDVTMLVKTHLKENLSFKGVKRKPPKIHVLDVETGKSDIYESTEVFAKLQGAKKNTIQCSVLRKKGRWKNFLISYIE